MKGREPGVGLILKTCYIWGGGDASVGEGLLSKCEALSSDGQPLCKRQTVMHACNPHVGRER